MKGGSSAQFEDRDLHSRQHLQLSIQTMPTQHAPLVPAPTEHRKRDRNGHVDPDLTGLDGPFKHPGRGSRVGEDRGTVAVHVSVDEFDGFLKRFGVEDREHWAKDLGSRGDAVVNGQLGQLIDTWRLKHSLVTLHALLGFEYGRPDPVALGIPIHLVATTIQQDLAALFLARRNQAFDLFLGRGRDDRAAVKGKART